MEKEKAEAATEKTGEGAISGRFSGAALAYLGDAVFETAVRAHLVRRGIADSGKLNRLALEFVRAGKQSEAVDRLLPHLTPNEEALFKRGRNTVSGAHPKSASAVEYRRATGLESLFGGLYLAGELARLDELFALAFPETVVEGNGEER